MPYHTKLVRKRVADSVIGKSCPICLNRVEIRSAAVVIPCLHAYCIGCIRRWSDCKRNCPLCNRNFSSWFCEINTVDDTFIQQKLSPLNGGISRITVNSLARDDVLRRRRIARFFNQRRLIRRFRPEPSSQSQARQLPLQRSFGNATHEHIDVIAERVKRWRASIYEKQLRAVPPATVNGQKKPIIGNNRTKEMILRRIEPWIKRELQSVLDDPDPTIIVHVATSLFIPMHENKRERFQGQVRVEDDYLAPLRRFLHDNTDLFWHELRCFAESPFSMETYDMVVEYN